MNNHSARPTGSITMPQTHDHLLKVLTTTRGAVERESGRGRGMPCSWSNERESPRIGSTLRRKEVTTVGKSRAIAIDAEQRGISLIVAAPPSTLLTFTNRARTKEKVNMSPTSSLSLKLSLRNTMTGSSVQVHASKWTRVRITFLMILIYLETRTNLQRDMLVIPTCTSLSMHAPEVHL